MYDAWVLPLIIQSRRVSLDHAQHAVMYGCCTVLFLQAMQGEVDEGSPFASPRTKHENRRLVRRMAAMVGNTEVSCSASHAGPAVWLVTCIGHQ